MCRQSRGEMMANSLSSKEDLCSLTWTAIHVCTRFMWLTKHPHVAGCGEPSEVDGLWSHPLDGQPGNRGCREMADQDAAGGSADVLLPKRVSQARRAGGRHLSYLCSILHPRCIGTDRSLPVSRNLEQQLICSGPRCLCGDRERNADGLQVNMSVSIVT